MTDTLTGHNLLAAICAEPWADDLRLIYADWLEDTGQVDRAEFIRVQIELAGIDPNKPYGEVLRRRQAELFVHHSDAWQEQCLPLADKVMEKEGIPNSWRFSCSWSRGFISSVECSCADWLEHGKAIVLAQPVVEVWLRDKKPYVYAGQDEQGAVVEYTNYRWFKGESDSREDSLPAELYEFGFAGFPTEQAAYAALSRACVTYARQKAKLPELTWPEEVK